MKLFLKVVKTWYGISVGKRYSNVFVTKLDQAINPGIDLVSSWLLSSGTMDQIKKLKMVLLCGHRTNLVTMHSCLNWLTAKHLWLYPLLVFFRNIIVIKIWIIFIKLVFQYSWTFIFYQTGYNLYYPP